MLKRIYRKYSNSNITYASILSKSRKLLQITGKDKTQILQGMTTNNVEKFLQDEKKGIQHTCFLNSKGKIITDAFLVKPMTVKKNKPIAKVDELWVEFPEVITPELSKHFGRHSFRKEINFNDISDHINFGDQDNLTLPIPGNLQEEFYTPLIDSEEDLDFSGEDEYIDNLSFDPRCSKLGLRMYTFNHRQTFEASELVERSKEDYDLLRFWYQIPEFEENFKNPPHKSNMDFLGSLDLKKGCFLGQELTARTAFNGIVRKRPFLVIIEKKNTEKKGLDFDGFVDNFNLSYLDRGFGDDLSGRKVKNSRRKRVLIIERNIGNYALGYFDYLRNQEYRLEDEEYVYHVVKNQHWDEHFKGYIKEITERAEKMSQFD